MEKLNLVKLAEKNGFISTENIVSEDGNEYSEYYIYELAKWLRDINRIYINIFYEYCSQDEFTYDIKSDKIPFEISSDGHWNKYENCLTYALQHCLNIFDEIKDPIYKLTSRMV